MKAKKRLIVLLSVLLVVCMAAGLAACRFVLGDEEHVHIYTKWAYDETQHWKVCPVDGVMDPETKSGHAFVEGVCICGANEAELQHKHTYDAWDYDDTQHWKYCDEHGDDKSHIDETTRDDTQHWKVCPEDNEMSPEGKSDHNFESGDCECGEPKPHVHDYSKWEHDDTQHWKVCPEDNEMSPEGKSDHNFESGDCECGMPNPHVHSYTQWEYNSSHHWKVCPDDGETGPDTIAAHNFDEGDCECGASPFFVQEDGSFDCYEGNYVDLVIPAELKTFPALTAIFGAAEGTTDCPDPKNWNKVQSVTVEDGSTTFKMESGALLSMDGTTLYAYFPYNTAETVSFPTVTTVAPCAFVYDATLHSVGLPKAETIGNYAFYRSALLSVDLPAIVEVGDDCFASSTLQTAVFGESFHRLSARTFQFCEYLTTFICKAVSAPLAYVNAFGNCTSLQAIYVPAESVSTYQTARIFRDFASKILAIEEPDPDWQVDEDGNFVAYTGDYVNLKIPAALKTFPALSALFGAESSSLSNCPNTANWQKVQSVTVAAGNTSFKMENGALLSLDGKTLYAYFAYNTADTLSFPTVTTVSAGSFFKIAGLKHLELPAISTIGRHAFYAASLDTLTLGENLTRIEMSAFANSFLTSITIKATKAPTALGSVLANCHATVYVPAESLDAYKTAKNWKTYSTQFAAIS